MAQTYTMDEAADRLGLPVEELKRKLKSEWTAIRSFRDGATLRFRAADIDELARTLGQASDPGLQLGAAGAAPPASSNEFLLPDDLTPLSTEPSPVDDIFALSAGDSGKSKKKKTPGDSDVRLEPGSTRGADPNTGLTDEINLDLAAGPGSGRTKPPSSAKLTAPPKSSPKLKSGDTGKMNKIPGPAGSADAAANTDSSSEFELSLDDDSDSFELQLAPDSSSDDGSEEVSLGGPPANKLAGQSGVNLGKPSDSGVSLEKKRPPADDSDDFELSLDPGRGDDSDSEFELSLDPGDAPAHSLPKSKKIPQQAAADSDSEFELTLDDNSGVADGVADELQAEAGQGDIFETDFELPAVSDDADSASEVVEVNSDTDLENSDFDIGLSEADIAADDESASEVVLLDDEDQPAPSGRGRAAAAVGAAGLAAAGAAAARGRRRPVDLEEDDDDAASELRGVGRRDDDEVGPRRSSNWGALPVAVLVPCLLLTFLGTLMSFELIRGMWGYQSGHAVSAPIAGGIADMLDLGPKK